MSSERTDNTRIRQFAELATGRPQLSVFLPALLLAAYWLVGEAAMVAIAVAIPAGLGLFWAVTLLWPSRGPIGKSQSAIASKRAAETMLSAGLRTEAQTGRTVAAVAVSVEYDANGGPALSARAFNMLDHQVAGTLAMCVRGDDMVVPLGDFSYAIALSPSPNADLQAVIALAKRLQASLAEPIHMDGRRHFFAACVGICLPGRSSAPIGAALLECAEIALTEARTNGHGSICTYSARLRKDRAYRTTLADDLIDAITSEKIGPMFRAQAQLGDGSLAAMHAEAGWDHPEKGAIARGDLMPLITESGRQAAVDKVMLSKIARQLRRWDEAGLHVPFVTYRVHAATLNDPNIPELLAWEIDRFHLASDRICLGLPASWVHENDRELADTVVARLAGAGVPLELHGFGRSHTSLPDLEAFGIHRLVLDKSFSARLDRDQDQKTLVRAMVGLAHDLSLQAVASGIDTTGEYAAARELKCDAAQGLAVSMSMPPEDATRWLMSEKSNVTQFALTGTAS